MDPGDDAVAGLVAVPKYVWVKGPWKAEAVVLPRKEILRKQNKK